MHLVSILQTQSFFRSTFVGFQDVVPLGHGTRHQDYLWGAIQSARDSVPFSRLRTGPGIRIVGLRLINLPSGFRVQRLAALPLTRPISSPAPSNICFSTCTVRYIFLD